MQNEDKQIVARSAFPSHFFIRSFCILHSL